MTVLFSMWISYTAVISEKEIPPACQLPHSTHQKLSCWVYATRRERHHMYAAHTRMERRVPCGFNICIMGWCIRNKQVYLDSIVAPAEP
jgi:hypothetical protein